MRNRRYYSINTVEKIKSFVDICNRFDYGVYVRSSDGFIVSGKSILGMFSLYILDELQIQFACEDVETCVEFYEEIERFEVKVKGE